MQLSLEMSVQSQITELCKLQFLTQASGRFVGGMGRYAGASAPPPSVPPYMGNNLTTCHANLLEKMASQRTYILIPGGIIPSHTNLIC